MVCRKTDEVLCTVCGQELTCKCLLNVCHDYQDGENGDDDDEVYMRLEVRALRVLTSRPLAFVLCAFWPLRPSDPSIQLF